MEPGGRQCHVDFGKKNLWEQRRFATDFFVTHDACVAMKRRREKGQAKGSCGREVSHVGVLRLINGRVSDCYVKPRLLVRGRWPAMGRATIMSKAAERRHSWLRRSALWIFDVQVLRTIIQVGAGGDETDKPIQHWSCTLGTKRRLLCIVCSAVSVCTVYCRVGIVTSGRPWR